MKKSKAGGKASIPIPVPETNAKKQEVADKALIKPAVNSNVLPNPVLTNAQVAQMQPQMQMQMPQMQMPQQQMQMPTQMPTAGRNVRGGMYGARRVEQVEHVDVSSAIFNDD